MRKRNHSGINRRIAVILAMLVALCGISAVFAGAADESGGSRVPVYKNLEELSGKRIGIQVGTVFDKFAEEAIPGVQIEYFSTFPDEINALKANKIDGVGCLESVIIQVQAQDDSIAIIEEPIGQVPLGFVFPKNEEGEKLAAEMSEFLTKMNKEGELDRLKAQWNETDESLKPIDDYRTLTAENGTLTFLTEGTFPPFDYFREGELVGYDVDIAIRFCREYGYGIEIKDMNFDALMPAVK